MQKYTQDLIHTLTQIEDPLLMKVFLQGILTPGELEEVGLRLQILRLLLKGYPQRKIAQQLKVSLAKVTRGSREIKYGHKDFLTILRTL